MWVLVLDLLVLVPVHDIIFFTKKCHFSPQDRGVTPRPIIFLNLQVFRSSYKDSGGKDNKLPPSSPSCHCCSRFQSFLREPKEKYFELKVAKEKTTKLGLISTARAVRKARTPPYVLIISASMQVLGESWQGFDVFLPIFKLQAALINKRFGIYSPWLASDESRCK